MGHISEEGEAGQLLWGCTNLGLIIISVLLQRKIFIVFGIMGFLGYLGHLTYEVFKGSVAFPFVLSLLGVAVIGLGILYQKNKARVERFVIGKIPDAIKKHLPNNRRNKTV